MSLNLAETAYTLTMDQAMDEAKKQFAMAEIDVENAWLWERGGWHMLLLWAGLNYHAPYCAKLAGPCPDDCDGLKVQCSDRLHGDCWRVKPPAVAGVSSDGQTLPQQPTPSPIEQEPTSAELLGAIARGWTHGPNQHKQMDPDLAIAIAAEVSALLSTPSEAVQGKEKQE